MTYTHKKYGTATVVFECDGRRYEARRGRGGVELLTRYELTQPEYDKAVATALSFFAAMDRDLEATMLRMVSTEHGT